MGPLRKQLAEHLCEINGYQPLALPHLNCTSLGPIRTLENEPIDWTNLVCQDSQIQWTLKRVRLSTMLTHLLLLSIDSGPKTF